jgi:hypothetical protein
LSEGTPPHNLKKSEMIEGISCQTRSPMRSIVGLCEQSGYRSFGEKFTNQNDFYSERISSNLIAASGILVPGPKIAAAPSL